MTRGRFIALEGGEGVGKSTQAQLLADAMRERGIIVDVTREPGGTPGAEAIRKILLDPPGEGWGAEAEALLFAAARSDHVARRILPAMARGEWVISDRFVDSSRAYQGGAGSLGDDTIVQLHQIGSNGLRPDLTLLIVVPQDAATRRLAQRDGDQADAIGGRSTDYHCAVTQAFHSCAMADPRGFAVIDGSGTPQEVHKRILAAITPLLGN